MKRVMLIGATGAGKRSLIRALSGESFTSSNAMAVEFCGRFVNTPGAFLENRRFYHPLITTAADCDIVLMLQDAGSASSLFPPQFASTLNKAVIGIISKTDLETANLARAERFLRLAGAKTIVPISLKDDTSLETLQSMLV